MKSSEIKDLIRYCVSKTSDVQVSTNTIGFNLDWNGENWIPYPNSHICLLSAILLVRQIKPSDKNISLFLNGKLFQELLVSETIKELLGVSADWLYGFFNGIQNISESTSDKNGWDTGIYFYKRFQQNK